MKSGKIFRHTADNLFQVNLHSGAAGELVGLGTEGVDSNIGNKEKTRALAGSVSTASSRVNVSVGTTRGSWIYVLILPCEQELQKPFGASPSLILPKLLCCRCAPSPNFPHITSTPDRCHGELKRVPDTPVGDQFDSAGLLS